MEALKPLAILAGVALTCALLAACVGLPSKGDIASAITAPAVDAAAVKFETALYVMAASLEPAVTTPDAGVDRAKLAKAIVKVQGGLDQARALFDKRSGDTVGLVSQTFDVLDDAVPMTASLRVRLALAAARSAVMIYADSLRLAGDPVPPSDDLVSARARTDRAVKGLLAALAAPS